VPDPVSLSDARNGLSDLVNRACYAGDRILLSKSGKPVAAVVSLDDLAALEAFEEAADIAAYDEAKAEYEADDRKSVPLAQITGRTKAR
jgi:prevent-host-death family protein